MLLNLSVGLQSTKKNDKTPSRHVLQVLEQLQGQVLESHLLEQQNALPLGWVSRAHNPLATDQRTLQLSTERLDANLTPGHTVWLTTGIGTDNNGARLGTRGDVFAVTCKHWGRGNNIRFLVTKALLTLLKDCRLCQQATVITIETAEYLKKWIR